MIGIYIMEQEHGAVLHRKQVESHQLPQFCLVPCHCSQLRPQNGVISYQETNMCNAEGMCATNSSPLCRHVLIVFTQFCYPGAVIFPAESSPPSNSELQAHLPGSMVSVEPCQHW